MIIGDDHQYSGHGLERERQSPDQGTCPVSVLSPRIHVPHSGTYVLTHSAAMDPKAMAAYVCVEAVLRTARAVLRTAPMGGAITDRTRQLGRQGACPSCLAAPQPYRAELRDRQPLEGRCRKG